MYRVYEVIGEEEEWVADIADERMAIEFVYYILEGFYGGTYVIRTPAGNVIDHDLGPEIQRNLHKRAGS